MPSFLRRCGGSCHPDYKLRSPLSVKGLSSLSFKVDPVKLTAVRCDGREIRACSVSALLYTVGMVSQ